MTNVHVITTYVHWWENPFAIFGAGGVIAGIRIAVLGYQVGRLKDRIDALEQRRAR